MFQQLLPLSLAAVSLSAAAASGNRISDAEPVTTTTPTFVIIPDEEYSEESPRSFPDSIIIQSSPETGIEDILDISIINEEIRV